MPVIEKIIDSNNQAYKSDFEKIEKQYGFKILYNDKQAIIKTGLGGFYTTTQVSPLKLSYAPQALDIALAKYPPNLMKKHLNTVFFVGEIQAHSKPHIAGFYHNNNIYIALNNDYIGAVQQSAEHTFHHEFSSLLMYAYKFPDKEWISIQADNNESYALLNKEIAHIIQNGDRRNDSPKMHKKGYIREYSHTSLENDFNEIAALTFSNKKEMSTLIQKYSALQQKYLLAKRFYLSIDSSFKTIFTE